MASPTAWRTTAAGRLTWSQGGQGRDTGSPGCDQAGKAEHRLPPAVAVVGQEVLQLQLRPGEGHPRIARGRAGQAHRLRPARLRAQAEDNRQVADPLRQRA